jgi:hypothetical protein
VCYCQEADEFVVTDATGALLQDTGLAQEILDDFFIQAEDSSEPEPQ